jgi:hypothetical protein
VFVEASRFPEQKNEEKLDMLVNVSTLYVVTELVEEDVIEFFYEKYIESVCEAYALVSVPLEQE